jgi:hypothetical protein
MVESPPAFLVLRPAICGRRTPPATSHFFCSGLEVLLPRLSLAREHSLGDEISFGDLPRSLKPAVPMLEPGEFFSN